MPYIKKTYVVTTEAVDFFSLYHDMGLAIKDAAANNGMVCVVVPKSGAGLLILKNSPEMRAQVESQLQVALLPRSIVLPIVDGTTVLAPYEEVFLVDCDAKVHRREVIIAVTAEIGGETE